MKKIVLLLAFTMLSFWAIAANEGKIDAALERISSEYEIESVKMDGAFFRMMMPLMKIDRKTRKAFKAMNIKEIVITDFQDEPPHIATKVIAQLTEAVKADGYLTTPQQSDQTSEDEEIKGDVYSLIEGDKVYGLVIITYFPKANFLCIRCDMNVSDLEEMVSAIMPNK